MLTLFLVQKQDSNLNNPILNKTQNKLYEKLIFLSIIILLFTTIGKAQFKLQNTTASSLANTIPGYNQVTTINTKSITYTAHTLASEPSPIDEDTTTENNGAYHYGDPVTINVSMVDGNYTTTNAGIVWTIKIIAYNAVNIGVDFSHFNLSANAEMYVYNSDKTELFGGIKAIDFSDTTAVGIPTLTGNAATIYIIEPNTETFQSSIAVNQIIAGFRALNNTSVSNSQSSYSNDLAVLENKYQLHGPSLIDNENTSSIWSID